MYSVNLCTYLSSPIVTDDETKAVRVESIANPCDA